MTTRAQTVKYKVSDPSASFAIGLKLGNALFAKTSRSSTFIFECLCGKIVKFKALVFWPMGHSNNPKNVFESSV